jgi:nitrogen regulatory protein P-II 1
MVRVTCVIRPHKLEQVKSAIAALGVSGMNVADVRGRGSSEEPSGWFGGETVVVPLPLKSKIEVVTADDMVDQVVRSILANARTGEPGDGKIFLERVEDAVRIRTGERGSAAI